MVRMDVAQTRQMIQAALRTMEPPPQGGERPAADPRSASHGGATDTSRNEAAPRPEAPQATIATSATREAAPQPAAQSRTATPEIATDRAARPTPGPTSRAALAEPPIDSVRVSTEGRHRLADSVLRILSDAARSDVSSSTAARTPAAPSPVSSQTIATVLADEAIRADVARLFSQPEVQARIPEFLAEPGLRETTVRLLAHPEMREAAREFFLPESSTRTAAELLSQPVTRTPMASILSRPEFTTAAFRAVDALPSADVLRSLEGSAEGRALLTRVLAEASPTQRDQALRLLLAPDTTQQGTGEARPSTPAAPPGNASTPTMPSASPESARLALFAQPEMRTVVASALSGNDADLSARLLSVLSRESIQSSARSILSALPATSTANLLAQPETAALLLRLAGESGMGELAQRLLTTPETTRVVVDQITRSASENAPPPSGPPASPSRPSTADRTAAAEALRLVLHATRSGQQESTRAAAAVLRDAQVAAALPDLLARIATRSALLEVLAQPEHAQHARALADSPSGRQAMIDILAGQSTNRIVPFQSDGQPPQSAMARTDEANVLRILADARSNEAVRQAVSDPRVALRIPELLARTDTRAVVTELLARPEVAEATNALFRGENGRALAEQLLAQSETRPSLARLAALLPEAARSTVAALSQPSAAAAAAEFFALPEGRAATAALLAQPSDMRSTLLRVLSQPQMTEAARAILALPEVRQELLRLLEPPPTASPTAASAERSASTPDEAARLLELLARSEMASTARAVFSSPEGVSRLVEMLRATTGADASSPARAQALSLLARDEMQSVARAVLERPEMAERLPQLLQDPTTRSAMVDLLSRSGVGEETLRLLASRGDTRQALANALTASLAEGVASPRDAATALRLMARPEAVELTAQVLSRPEVAARVADLLASPETRSPMVEILSAPQQNSRLLQVAARPEVRAALAQIVASGDTQSQAVRLLAQPAMANVVLRAASEHLEPAALQRLVAQEPMRAELVRLLGEPAAREAVLNLLSRPEARAAAEAILSRPATSRHIAPLMETAATRAQLLEILAAARPGTDLAASVRPSLSSPEALRGLAQVFATPSSASPSALTTEQTAALRVLAWPEMAEVARQVLQMPEARTTLAQVLAKAPLVNAPSTPSSQTPASPERPEAPLPASEGHMATREEIGSLIRMLSRPAMAETARSVLSSSEASAALNRALEAVATTTPQTQPLSRADTAALLEILSRPEMATVAREAFSTGEARNLLARVLATPLPEAPTPQRGPELVLRVLARPELGDAARDVLSRPEVAQRIPEFLTNARTRGAMLEILLMPEMRETAPRLLASAEARQALTEALATPAALRQIPRLVAQPEMAGPLTEALSRPESTAVAQRMLAREAVQAQLASLVTREPATRQAALELLSRPEFAEAGRQVLARDEARAHLPELLRNADTRRAVLEILSRPGAGQLAREALSTPAAREAMVNALASAASPEGAARPQPAETAALLRTLAHPEATEAARIILAEPRSLAAVADALARAETRQAAVELLSRPHLAQVTRLFLAQPEALQAIETALLSVQEPRVPGLTPPAGETASQILAMLARLDQGQEAARILGQQSIQALAASLLASPHTRTATLGLLALPAMAQTAARILRRPDVQAEILRMARSEATRAQLVPLLQRPEMVGVLESLLALPASPREAQGPLQQFLESMLAVARGETQQTDPAVPKPEISTRLARRGSAPGTVSPHGRGTTPISARSNVANWGVQGGSEAPLAAMRGRTGPNAFLDLPATLSKLFGTPTESPLPRGGTHSLRSKTFLALEKALTHLQRVSPRRGAQALRTLSLLARLGVADLDGLVSQVSGRLEQIATQSAMKGGLPASLSEPILTNAPQVLLRLGPLSTTDLLQTVRGLANAGADISFVGRSATGDVQIHLLVAELAASSAERAASPTGPGIVAHANLTPQEVTALRGILPQAGISTAQPTQWHPDARTTLAQDQDLFAPRVATPEIRPETPGAPRAPDILAARPDAAPGYAFNYHLAVLFPWFDFSAEPSEQARQAAIHDEEGDLIPTMLDLVAAEPLLLTYEPGEILVPGTDIPLLTEPDTTPDFWFEALD